MRTPESLEGLEGPKHTYSKPSKPWLDPLLFPSIENCNVSCSARCWTWSFSTVELDDDSRFAPWQTVFSNLPHTSSWALGNLSFCASTLLSFVTSCCEICELNCNASRIERTLHSTKSRNFTRANLRAKP